MSNSSSPIINPGAQSWELLRQRHQYVARGIDNATEIFAARAEGAIIEDIEGNRHTCFSGVMYESYVTLCRLSNITSHF